MGEYYFRNGTHYIKYDEMMEGFAEKTQNLIKIKDHSVELEKGTDQRTYGFRGAEEKYFLLSDALRNDGRWESQLPGWT